ncbi:MAG: cupin domain-containing protein [Chloroflexi bacterium]|nr:cupin domain-containing protein [Chloroflexota bacterium]
MSHERGDGTCTVIRNDQLEVEINSGAMTRMAGVSGSLTGSAGIHMAIATVPPGRCSTTHYHTNCESAIYVVSGRGLFLSGPELGQEDEIAAGDFIYVPPDSTHQPVNTSQTENLVLIVVRNTPVELVVELAGLGRRDCL